MDRTRHHRHPAFALNNDMAQRLHQAVQCHQAGRVSEAVAIYETILAESPDQPDALHLLGLGFHHLKKYDQALALIQRAVQICPDNASYYNSLGMVLKELKRPHEAAATYGQALALAPDLVASHNNLAILLQDLGRPGEAILHFKKALTLNPDNAELHNNLGNAFQGLRQPEKALPCYHRAVEIAPSYGEAFHNMGRAYLDLGEWERAVECLEKALRICPESLETILNMGVALEKQGRYKEAIGLLKKGITMDPNSFEVHDYLGTLYIKLGRAHAARTCFKKALAINPGDVHAQHNMGMSCQEQGDPAQALRHYQKALALKPDFAEAFHNAGTVFQYLGKLETAMHHFHQALAINPDLCQTLVSLGNVFMEMGKPEESRNYYEKAVEKNPEYAKAHSHLLHLARETCDWHAVEQCLTALDHLDNAALKRGEKTAQMPHLSLMREAAPSFYLAVAGSWSRSIAKKMSHLVPPFSFENRCRPKKKITVGYISNSFRNHPGCHLISGLFKLHNRNYFNVLCYSYGEDDGSFYRKRVARDCDRFADIKDLDHGAAARLIYQDEVDILVDLRGHTKGNRFISALKPAPVQVSYLGYPGTTGADFFDYLITDKTVSPESHAPYYSEKLVYMPDCYQINDHEQPISDKIYKKSDFHIPKKSFVFCSFNGPNKIEPVMFDTWMKILLQVPESILWLLKINDFAEKNLKQAALSKGVAPERLIFSKGLPKADHLARFRLADLALDTRVYNGHTTTSDALWAGVPVITLKGNYFPGRVSAGILKAVSLPELITHTLKDYETLAVRLANNPSELYEIQQKLAKNRFIQPLFDTPKFVRHLEAAFQEMWGIRCAGSPPQQIEIT